MPFGPGNSEAVCWTPGMAWDFGKRWALAGCAGGVGPKPPSCLSLNAHIIMFVLGCFFYAREDPGLGDGNVLVCPAAWCPCSDFWLYL